MNNLNFDIDLVYLWVDSNDSNWLEKKTMFTGESYTDLSEINCEGRYISNDELRYSLRSIEMNANWVRNIYIVTDNQHPHWLNFDNPKIHIIDHSEILPAEALPCYNSVIIEHFLYKIPGLSEHFIYANDDMFIGRKIAPSFFFNQKGNPIVRLQRYFGGRYINFVKKHLSIESNIYRKTIENSAKLINNKFGKFYSGTPHHNIDAYLKSDYQKVSEVIYSEEIKHTITNHLRHESDIQRIIYSYYLLAIEHGERRYVKRNESCRIRLQNKDFMLYIQKYNPYLFCLNDTQYATENDRERVTPFLTALFPQKSSYEI